MKGGHNFGKCKKCSKVHVYPKPNLGKFKIPKNRKCQHCQSKDTYRGTTKYAHWHTNPLDNKTYLCSKCYSKLYGNPKWRQYFRLMRYRGKLISIDLGIRRNICEFCGKKEETQLHHIKYDDSDILAYTVELCAFCHAKEHGFGTEIRPPQRQNKNV